MLHFTERVKVCRSYAKKLILDDMTVKGYANDAGVDVRRFKQYLAGQFEGGKQDQVDNDISNRMGRMRV